MTKMSYEFTNKLRIKGYTYMVFGRSKKYYITSGEHKIFEIDGIKYDVYGLSNIMFQYRGLVKEIRED